MVKNALNSSLTWKWKLSKLVQGVMRVLLASKKFRNNIIYTLREYYPDETFEVFRPAVSRLSPDILERTFKEVFHHYANLNHNRFIGEWCIESIKNLTGSLLGYGQEGEDVLLERWLGECAQGCFVDVGAFHPIRFSNTYTFYRRGWRGLNIDATPGSMEVFNRVRPEDINIEFAVSDSEEYLRFYLFSEGALNTFDSELAESYVSAGCELLEIQDIKPRPLSALLDDYWSHGRMITLMNIDVEGKELEVLRSNNWEKYRPEWIILELLDLPLMSLSGNPCVIFLLEQGYTVVSKLMQSVIFKRN